MHKDRIARSRGLSDRAVLCLAAVLAILGSFSSTAHGDGSSAGSASPLAPDTGKPVPPECGAGHPDPGGGGARSNSGDCDGEGNPTCASGQPNDLSGAA